jgi:hypothetical protein
MIKIHEIILLRGILFVIAIRAIVPSSTIEKAILATKINIPPFLPISHEAKSKNQPGGWFTDQTITRQLYRDR